ncbi:recombinase family protein [Actinomyces sp. Marseille-P3109]|uniref:recombinase family protein n=1 Tax=Actinomyces sp. Marseille-P3109 TaxID=2083009 RepID=UPI001F481FD0|nr:recombinase family protein [Actinomyces sp. Marseille-P3109]
MTTQTKTNARDERPTVLEAVSATALDSQAGTGAIAIFYGAARYPFELARQRELVEDYAEQAGLNLVTEFHDRQQRQDGLSMLLDACRRGGVEYVITASWPTPNLTTTEADAVVEQLAASGTHLVCLNSWRPGDGTPPAWWNDEEGAWIRQLDALREEDRRQREQTNQPSQPGETGGADEVDQAGEASQPSDGNQASRTGNASEHTETTKEVHHA